MIQNIEPKKLIDYNKNAKNHPKEQIEKLARAFKAEGFHGCIIADENLVIIAGHGRKYAAIEAGLDTIPVQILNGLSEEQKRSKRLGDNKLAESDWLDDFLKDELTFLKDANYDLSLSGFDSYFAEEEPVNTNDPEDCPSVDEVELRCNLGDIWLLGEHKLLVGDSTDEANIFLLMQREKAHLVFTDPPYNQETDGGFKGEIGKSLRKQSEEIEHLCNFEPENFLKVLPTVFDKNMNAYCFCNKDLVPDYLNWAKNLKYSFNILMWKKPNAIPLKGTYKPDVEYLLVFRKNGIFNNNIDGINYSKVLEFGREKDKVHPTMKPIDLIENQLKIASNVNSIVLDFFGGSGSTLIACEKTKRICRTMELDPKYASVIIERWEKYTGKIAEKIGGNNAN
jgi:DNA modification methylase